MSLFRVRAPETKFVLLDRKVFFQKRDLYFRRQYDGWVDFGHDCSTPSVMNRVRIRTNALLVIRVGQSLHWLFTREIKMMGLNLDDATPLSTKTIIEKQNVHKIGNLGK